MEQTSLHLLIICLAFVTLAAIGNRTAENIGVKVIETAKEFFSIQKLISTIKEFFGVQR